MRAGLTAAAIALSLSLVGCGGGGDGVVAGEPSSSPSRLTLVTEPRPSEGGMDAIVSGVLGVNDLGCVTIDGGDAPHVLIAPYGSTAADDETVDLVGLGRFTIGDSVRGAGGWLDVPAREPAPEFVAPCLPADGPKRFATIRGE